VYPDSMRCLPASLRRGPGGPRCPHRSDAGTEIRDSVNEALRVKCGQQNCLCTKVMLELRQNSCIHRVLTILTVLIFYTQPLRSFSVEIMFTFAVTYS